MTVGPRVRNAPAGHRSVPVTRRSSNSGSRDQDQVCVEEPLEIRLAYGSRGAEISLSVTMRTPGDDEELALGFLYGEGIVAGTADIRSVEPCGPPSPDKGLQNVVKVTLSPKVTFDPERFARNFYTSSSCGVCGKSSIDAVRITVPRRSAAAPFAVAFAQLAGVPRQVRSQQLDFERTGGTHAAALFSPQGNLLLVREDVGRHNAVDKVIGARLIAGHADAQEVGLFLSGRAGFELVQKGAVAGVPLIASVGPPSNLAVELAEQEGITLVGFLGDERCNVYCGDQRITD